MRTNSMVSFPSFFDSYAISEVGEALIISSSRPSLSQTLENAAESMCAPIEPAILANERDSWPVAADVYEDPRSEFRLTD